MDMGRAKRRKNAMQRMPESLPKEDGIVHYISSYMRASCHTITSSPMETVFCPVLGCSHLPNPNGSKDSSGGAEKIPFLPPFAGSVNSRHDESEKKKSMHDALGTGTSNAANRNSVSLNGDNHDLVSEAANAVHRLHNLLPLFKKSKKSKGGTGEVENTPGKVKGMIVMGDTLLSNLLDSDAIQEGIQQLHSGNSHIMAFLKELSMIHPISAAVFIAFETAWKLVKARQENDKRIMALYIRMVNMVTVFGRLCGVSKKKTKTKNNKVETICGFTLEGVSEKAIEDIKKCSNMCEVYSKTNTIVKVLNSGYWQGEFTKYLKKFERHRLDLEFALTIHIFNRVEEVVELQQEYSESISQMNEKLSNVSSSLEKLASPAEKEFVLFAKKRGGTVQIYQKIKSNDAQSDVLLRELNDYEREKLPNHGGLQEGPEGGKQESEQDTIEDLRQAIQADQDQVIQMNLEGFQRKFDTQQKKLEQAIDSASDKIIRTLSAGMHSRIIDQDARKVWKVMKWGGSVKARHFVVALHDYFADKWGLDEHDFQLQDRDPTLSLKKLRGKSSRAKREDIDLSALSSLNPANAQTLSEAFDEDASGYISVGEVNDFIASKPEKWSLLLWMAYWVKGWHHSQWRYRDGIQALIAKLVQRLPSVRRENRSAADEYTETMLFCVLPLIYGLNPIEYDDEASNTRFKEYDEQEEQRLENTLNGVRHTINGKDSVQLITGTGQIEKIIFPLLYLLLKRHLDIFRVAERLVLHPSELKEARDSIKVVIGEVSDRVRRLESIFAQQNLRVDEHFQRFANGIFNYVNDPTRFWSTDVLLRIDPSRSYFSVDNNEEDNLNKGPDLSVCNHPTRVVPLWTLEDAFKKAYSSKTEVARSDTNPKHDDTRNADGAEVSNIVNIDDTATHEWISKLSCGEWSGFFQSNHSSLHGELLLFTFNADNTSQTDKHVGVTLEGSVLTPAHEYPVSKTCAVICTDEGITIQSTDDEESQLRGSILFRERTIITGKMTFKVSPTKTAECTFLLEQHLHHAAYNQYRPASPSESIHSEPQTLWRLVAVAIRFRAWALRQRKGARGRFVDILTERKLGKTLEDEECNAYWFLQQKLKHEDQECYEALVHHRFLTLTRHGGYTCDNCNRRIYGTRTFCLNCVETNGYATIDFCDRHDCITTQGTHDRVLTTPHLRSHTLLRTRKVVFLTMLGRVVKDAKATEDTVKRLLHDASMLSSRPHDTDRLTCTFCPKKVSPPFWACIDCDDITCVCYECDKAGKVVVPEDYDSPHNLDEHVLVLVKQQTSGVVMPTAEERLASMESKVDRLLAALPHRDE